MAIDQLIIVAGPTSVGKSTLMDAMRAGEERAVAARLGLDDVTEWEFLSARKLVRVERAWTQDSTPLVITGFENVLYFPTREGHLVGLDPESGEFLFDRPGGFAANVTMASDLRTLVTNQINFGQKPPAGVWGWRSPD